MVVVINDHESVHRCGCYSVRGGCKLFACLQTCQPRWESAVRDMAETRSRPYFVNEISCQR